MTEFCSHPGPSDWQELRALELDARVRVIVLTDSVRELLFRVAPSLLIEEKVVEQMVSDSRQVARLVVEMRRRIRAGSRALASTLAQAHRLKNNGEEREARALLEQFADGDELPFYREIAAQQVKVFGL